jgi:hypothetical protein
MPLLFAVNKSEDCEQNVESLGKVQWRAGMSDDNSIVIGAG